MSHSSIHAGMHAISGEQLPMHNFGTDQNHWADFELAHNAAENDARVKLSQDNWRTMRPDYLDAIKDLAELGYPSGEVQS